MVAFVMHTTGTQGTSSSTVLLARCRVLLYQMCQSTSVDSTMSVVVVVQLIMNWRMQQIRLRGLWFQSRVTMDWRKDAIMEKKVKDSFAEGAKPAGWNGTSWSCWVGLNMQMAGLNLCQTASKDYMVEGCKWEFTMSWTWGVNASIISQRSIVVLVLYYALLVVDIDPARGSPNHHQVGIQNLNNWIHQALVLWNVSIQQCLLYQCMFVSSDTNNSSHT